MNTFREHIPSSVQRSDEPLKEIEFNKPSELFENELILKWATREGFYRFSLSDNRLIAEYAFGTIWWVVGSLAKPEEMKGLPLWQSDEQVKYLFKRFELLRTELFQTINDLRSLIYKGTQ